MSASNAVALLADIEDFEVRHSTDTAKGDMELICPRCDGVVCDVEDRDSLGVLVRCVEDHFLSCFSAPEVPVQEVPC